MKTYEFKIRNLEVEEILDVEANSQDEAYDKMWDKIDKVAKELGVTVDYNIDCLTEDEEEDYDY